MGKVWWWAASNNVFDDETNLAHLSEQDVLAIIRSIFIFTDEQFEELKKAGQYTVLTDVYSYYKDGTFVLPGGFGWGGDPTYHTLLSYEDNKQGVIQLFFEYNSRQFDELPVKYVMEYVYTGSSDIQIDSVYEEEIDCRTWFFTSYDPDLLNSLRIRSIKEIKD